MRVRNRWVILSVSMAAQIASVAAMYGVPYVLPQLRDAYGLSTAQAGMLVGLPAFGLLVTLLAWGVVIDRVGERPTMALSLLLTAGALALLPLAAGPWTVGGVLFLAGAAGGPVNAASGRLILSWFSARERGLAMGIRQSALPLGMGIAAVVLPVAAERWGFIGAMLLPAALAAAAAPTVLLLSPPPQREATGTGGGRGTRPGEEAGPEGSGHSARGASGSPYRAWTIWRVHGVSMLLGVPQISLMAYALVYLVQEHGWSAPAAGAVVAAAQVPGAAGRLLLGLASDRIGDRMRPVRVLASVSTCCLLLLAAVPGPAPWTAVPLLLVCLVLSMSHNGLTFTSVAEIAGTAWAGRALAAQNWLQAVSTTLTPVMMAPVIDGAGLPAVFAACAVFAAAAAAAVPVTSRRS
ncbi:MFS transporter [Nocardiopsis sp. RSe5-2]|uniref:MFS transporter n=1 Tax=Nocardiopsis endophytica TaxID=3018445 RepID=A0ABT4U9G3_9ACTN|nr:MFS transporter [Nocardiopsis endophytica]MDA2813050.1 MFS transporter [Nocardiopsis endophytica]